jgi:glycosyltransferase involved in cell wall biosynthesis
VLRLFLPSTKVVSTVHNVYERDWRWRMMAYRLTDGLSSHTTAVSQAAADHFVRSKAAPTHKCIVLLNGIDTDEFMPSAERRSLTREGMAAGHSFIWLAVGRLVPAKDYPNMLRAFRQVRAAFPDAQLWIAGASADGLQKRAEDAGSGSLLDFAAERGWMEQVRLLGLRRDMLALFDASDGFVSSSAWEGMPLAVGEAMAMEKPVVATDVGGTRELVDGAGSIVRAGDSDALAAAMLDLMRQPAETRQNYGRAARVRVVQHFSMDVRADAWEALYRDVVTATH